MTVELVPIVAVARNGVIGKDNALPWKLSADLKRFKAITTGHPVIMGRRTWLSIGRPLPNRVNIVVTRDPAFEAGGAEVVHSLDEASTAAAKYAPRAYVIGGADVYRQAFPLANHVRLTILDLDFDGDTTLPPLDPTEWKVVAAESHEEGGLRFVFVDLERVQEGGTPPHPSGPWHAFLAAARGTKP